MLTNGKIKVAAKINLTLKITGTKGTMHTLETAVSSIGLFDEAEYSLSSSGRASVRSGSRLECFDAARFDVLLNGVVSRFESRYGSVGCDVSIVKNIPPGAGLGGSSAATVCLLRALIAANEASGKKIIPDNDFLLSLGSDVPYMFYGGPAVLKGLGDEVTEIAYAPLFFAAIIPETGVDSGECYSLYDKLNAEKYAINKQISETRQASSLGEVLKLGLSNDLQDAAEILNPDVSAARNIFLTAGAENIIMSGSGSTVIAVYDTPEKAESICKKLKCSYKTAVYSTVEKQNAIQYYR